jgi:hypothetical protein
MPSFAPGFARALHGAWGKFGAFQAGEREAVDPAQTHHLQLACHKPVAAHPSMQDDGDNHGQTDAGRQDHRQL